MRQERSSSILKEPELEIALLGIQLCSLPASKYPFPSSPDFSENHIYFIQEVLNKLGKSTSYKERGWSLS